MRRNNLFCLRWIAVIALALFLRESLFPQTSSATEGRRDAAAVLTVQAAIGALGGQAALSAIQDATVTGSCSLLDGSGSSGTSHSFVWTVAGKEFRYDSVDTDGEHLFVSGYGTPKVAEGGSTSTIPPLVGAVMKPYHLPGLVLVRELQDTTRNILSAGTETISGIQAVHVRITTTVGGVPVPAFDQDWYFNPSTHLPLAVKYRIPTVPVSGTYLTATVLYLSFDTSQAIPVLQQMAVDYDPSDRMACTFGTPKFNTQPPSMTFDISE